MSWVTVWQLLSVTDVSRLALDLCTVKTLPGSERKEGAHSSNTDHKILGVCIPFTITRVAGLIPCLRH